MFTLESGLTDPYQQALATPQWLEALRLAMCAHPALANLEGAGVVTSPHAALDPQVFRYAFQVTIVSNASGPLQETWWCDLKWEPDRQAFHIYGGGMGPRNRFRWRESSQTVYGELPCVDLEKHPPDPALSDCAVSRRQAEKLCILPIRQDGPYLEVALGDPAKLESVELGLPFRPVMASSRLSVELGIITLYSREPDMVVARIDQAATEWVTVSDELAGRAEKVIFGTDFHGWSFTWDTFGEAELSSLGPNNQGFRLFLRMTNFGPWGAIVVRVQLVRGRSQWVVKRFTPPSGPGRSDLVLQTRLLSDQQWRDLAGASGDARIWITPGPACRISDLGVGTVRYWHLEHWDGTRLRCSTRLAPAGGALVDFALRILSLAEVEVKVRRSKM